MSAEAPHRLGSSHSREAATARTAPLALWRVAEAFLHILYNLFGAPEDVARQHTLTRKPYRLLLSWLRVGEAMMRRLIVIEAAAFPKPNTRPLLWSKRQRTPRLVGFDHDKPEDWRVSFRCFSHSAHGGRVSTRGAMTLAMGAAAPRKRITREERWSYEHFAPQSFHSAWPLAERYEALIRVFNAPAAYARRLAARLHARLHLLPAILKAPCEYEHRVDRAEALTHAAEVAWPRGANTS